jgi:dihydrofolate reductase
VKDNIAEEVSSLKQQSGGDMIILGSPGLTHSLTELDLIDEYKINVNPIVIGDGIPLFKDVNKQMKLKLVA